MRRDEIKRLVEAYGPAAFVRRFAGLLCEKKIKPEQVSIRALWEGLVGPVEETLHGAHQVVNEIHFVGLREEVGTTAFPKATGALLAAKVIEGYQAPGFIGDRLVSVMPSRRRTETIVGFTGVDGPLEVEEGMPYEDSDIGEKYVTSTAAKRGRIISVTEEAIMEDQTGQLLRRAALIGEKTRQDKERRILKGVTGNDANVYKPSGTAADYYSAGNANVVTSNSLVDWTDVDGAMQKFAGFKDEKSDEIAVFPRQLLVPYALLVSARRIVNATEVRENANPSAGTADKMTVSPNPFAGMFEVLTSPIMDGFTNGTTNWFLGDFPKGFFYHEIWPIQTLAAKEGHEDEFDRDVVFKYKVREYGGINAVDYRYAVKSSA